ncbi:MAG: class I tRNA ligase family protein, partial [Candidatus Dojkabacteria bacterium]|nr:class I tRNA ligase family protein [Candidatus Dojkabacteria bacterium]
MNQRQNFIKMEEELLSWWKKNDIVRKYLARNSKAQKHFSFIDGPITANNPMGLHHAWGRTYKDLWQRFKNMQGYEQRFQNGFDCQGLWVEVEVEKELGFNSKKDILDYGLDKFTNQCVARVKRFAQKQTEQSVRLGMFMDWENSYYTMSETNNLYIWRFLKKCQEDGMLYKSKSSTVWCPRCETGLSQHEQADGYKEITDVSVYVKFQVAGRENEYFLVWTTTPWTLTSNVLLAINTKHPYVATEVDGETWYVAEESAKRLGLEKNKPVAAKELLKLEFETLYPHIPKQKDVKHFVVDWDLVDPSEGTGIVHIA